MQVRKLLVVAMCVSMIALSLATPVAAEKSKTVQETPVSTPIQTPTVAPAQTVSPAPTVSLSAETKGSSGQAQLQIVITASSPLSGANYSYYVNGVLTRTGTLSGVEGRDSFSVTLDWSVATGQNTWVVTANDSAGNQALGRYTMDYVLQQAVHTVGNPIVLMSPESPHYTNKGESKVWLNATDTVPMTTANWSLYSNGSLVAHGSYSEFQEKTTYSAEITFENSPGINTLVVMVNDSDGKSAIGRAMIIYDNEIPTITGYSPVGEDISVNSSIYAVFSEEMDQSSVLLEVDGMDGIVEWNENNISFVPSAPLTNGTVYNVTISGKDLVGNSMKFSWNFTTEGVIESNATITIGAGAITGVVKGSDRKAIEGALVVLNETLSTKTDENGSFSFVNLTSGSYNLTVTKDGYQTLTQNVTVPIGKTVSVALSILAINEAPTNSDGVVFLGIIAVVALGILGVSLVWKRRKH